MKTTLPIRLMALLVTGVSIALAQPSPVRFRRLTTGDGLAANSVRAIMQDRQGFLWFSNYGGISRFDGYSFKNYRHDARDTTTLGGNHVIDLWEAPNGFIWAAISNGGLARLDPRTDRVRRYMADRHRPGGLHTNDVTAVQGDRAGNIWVGTVEGLARFDTRTETFTRYRHDPRDSTTLSTTSMVSGFLESRDGTIWIATVDRGFNRIQVVASGRGTAPSYQFVRYEHNPANPASLSNNQVMDLFEDHAGVLWVGTFDGLNRFDPKTGRCTAVYRHDPRQTTSISSNRINRRSIAEDRQGNLWVGTQVGLNRLNRNRTEFSRFYYDFTDPGTVGDNVITSVCVDRTGILWVGTNDAGISIFDPNRRTLPFVGTAGIRPTPFAAFNIRGMAQDRAGWFWIGTEGGGLIGYDPHTKQFRTIRKREKRTGLPTDFIGPMLTDRTGAIWMGMGSDWQSGTHGQITRFLPQTGQFTTFLPFPTPHSYAFVLSITEDERGVLWFGTGNMGLIAYDPTTNRWRQYKHTPGDSASLRGKWMRAVVSDRRGHIWVGTDAGLDRLDYRTGQITHFVNNPRDPSSLSSDYILSLCLDRTGTLWVGTDGGLCRYNSQGQTFRLYTEKDGLPDNTIANLINDNNGNLWLNTGKGLCRFSPQSETFTAFDADNSANNNFLSGNIQVGTVFKAADGTLHVGGKGRIVSSHPRDLRFNPIKPPVVLTRVSLFDKPLPGSYDGQTLTLNHDQNSLTLEFSALNYTSAEKNQYAWQLDPFEPGRVFGGTRRSVTYTNLNPGTYTFRVKGSNNDGLWNETGTRMTLIIRPAWWQTVWFRVLVGLIVAGLAYAFYRYRLAQLRRDQTLRDQIARDLHDDVGGVLSGISFYSEAASAMHRQGRFDDSYVLLQKIADNARTTIDRMSDVVWSMRSDTGNAGRLSERLASFGRELLGGRNIRLLVETEPGLERLALPPDVLRNLYLIGKEALHNAAKHSDATEVQLRIGQTGGKINLIVQDNGRGFGIDAPESDDGNGLANMRKRAEAIGIGYSLTSSRGNGTVVAVG